MPVRKYRSVEEMPVLEAPALDPDNLRRALALSRTCLALERRTLPRGVHRHRSLEEATAWLDHAGIAQQKTE